MVEYLTFQQATTTKGKKAPVAKAPLNPPTKRKATEDAIEQPPPKKAKSITPETAPKKIKKTAAPKNVAEKSSKVSTSVYFALIC